MCSLYDTSSAKPSRAFFREREERERQGGREGEREREGEGGREEGEREREGGREGGREEGRERIERWRACHAFKVHKTQA